MWEIRPVASRLQVHFKTPVNTIRIRSALGAWAPDHEPASFSHELRIRFGYRNYFFFLEELKDLRLQALLKIAGITPKALAVLKLFTLGPASVLSEGLRFEENLDPRTKSREHETKDDVTRDDSQRHFLAQHSVAMLEQCCKHLKQCRNNVAMLCCAYITLRTVLPPLESFIRRN